MGDSGWHDAGTNGLNPFDRLFLQPDQIGRHAGFPIFNGYTGEPDTTSPFGFFFLSRKNVLPYLPVGRERLLKVLIAKATEICVSGKGGTGKQNDQRMLDSLNRQLSDLKTGEREQPACYLRSLQEPGMRTGGFEGVVAMGTPGCIPVARLNPALIDTKLPRTALQLVVVQTFMDIEASGYPDKRVDSWTTLNIIMETDWSKVLNLLDRP
jgi:hypothetical protein